MTTKVFSYLEPNLGDRGVLTISRAPSTSRRQIPYQIVDRQQARSHKAQHQFCGGARCCSIPVHAVHGPCVARQRLLDCNTAYVNREVR